MGYGRKRPKAANKDTNNPPNDVGKQDPQHKRQCAGPDRATPTGDVEPFFEHPVLSRYFPRLLTLRKYFEDAHGAGKSGAQLISRLGAINSTTDPELSSVLDSAIVGLASDISNPPNVDKEIADATQCTPGSGQPNASIAQSDLVDIVLHILFRRSLDAPRGSRQAVYPGKPNHILGLGYTVPKGRGSLVGCHVGPMGVRVLNTYPNSHVNTLKSRLWERLLQVIGEEPMFKLLLGTSIFVRLGAGEEGQRKYYQLSGPPISDTLNTPTAVVVPDSNRATETTLGKFQGHGPPVKRTTPEIDNPAKQRAGSQANADHPMLTQGKRDTSSNVHPPRTRNQHELGSDKKTHGEIVFVRSRMFYARPAHNKKGETQFGLRHIHVLNRFPSTAEDARHILMYLFPRQYGLHNVFTSVVNRQETMQPFQDYTFRELEIERKYYGRKPAVPRRLKGKVLALVVKMQRLHRNCPYHALIKYYCPASLCDPDTADKRVRLHVQPINSSEASPESSGLVAQEGLPPSVPRSSGIAEGIRISGSERFTEFALSTGEVSGFVKAVIGRVIPDDFFGSGENKKLVVQMVDRFIKLRRYESFSLHQVLQGLKLTDCDWLRPPSVHPDEKMSKTDAEKRRELLAEFVYWLFDSFVIPLLRAHFYITESGVDRNRVFYFRHDVWGKLSEPALDHLKLNMYQEMKRSVAKQILASRKLGFSELRLLPKENGVRPIMNLKKRGMVVRNGQTRLTPSINTIMTPVFNALVFEKSRKPEQLGSSMFSVNEMYPRLKAFQARLVEKGWQGCRLYFAKVDVQACFDTIPQPKLLALVKQILEEKEYRINKYVEVRPPASFQKGTAKPFKKFVAQARPGDEIEVFSNVADSIRERLKPGTVLVDDVVGKTWDTEELLVLLEMHIRDNVIKVGKKYYKQRTGIPQGSVLSSILCNFFYGDLERTKLSFLIEAEDSLLLRLIDDFLLITLDHSKATRFLKTMHDGIPEYGATVNPDKSLVNFETAVNGKRVQRLVGTREFPYCGTVVNTQTLGLRRDQERYAASRNIADSLTVEYSRRPGAVLLRRVIASFWVHTHKMFLDINLNGAATVVHNVYYAFVECAMKFYRYVRALGGVPLALQVRAIRQLFLVAEGMAGKEKIRREWVLWLGARAFARVLRRKQTWYRGLVGWLENVEKREGVRPVGADALGLGKIGRVRY